jgi:hypothetical protein
LFIHVDIDHSDSMPRSSADWRQLTDHCRIINEDRADVRRASEQVWRDLKKEMIDSLSAEIYRRITDANDREEGGSDEKERELSGWIRDLTEDLFLWLADPSRKCC